MEPGKEDNDRAVHADGSTVYMGLRHPEAIIDGQREPRRGERLVELDTDFASGFRSDRRDLLVSSEPGSEFSVGPGGGTYLRPKNDEKQGDSGAKRSHVLPPLRIATEKQPSVA